jgi:hypothetical protein
MKNNRWILAVVAALIVIGGFWLYMRNRRAPSFVDLIQEYPSAQKRSNMDVDKAFRLETVTINGQAMKVIFAHPTSRIIWKVRMPDDAWLKTSLALKPMAWTTDSDGVLFRIGVSDGKKYDELLNQHVDPVRHPGDRRWVPITLDLSAYGGQTVDVIFNTGTGPPKTKSTPNNDWAVWGAPEISVRR